MQTISGSSTKFVPDRGRRMEVLIQESQQQPNLDSRQELMFHVEQCGNVESFCGQLLGVAGTFYEELILKSYLCFQNTML